AGSGSPSPTSTRWTAPSTSTASIRSPRHAPGWAVTATTCRPGSAEESTTTGEAAMKLYDKALVTIDEMGNELTRDRIREFCLLNCEEVYLCYIAPEHIIAGEVGHSLAVGEHGGDVDVTQGHVDALQEYVDLLAA